MTVTVTWRIPVPLRTPAASQVGAAATESMNAQAGVLLQLVSRFELGDGGRGAALVLEAPAALGWRAA